MRLPGSVSQLGRFGWYKVEVERPTSSVPSLVLEHFLSSLSLNMETMFLEKTTIQLNCVITKLLSGLGAGKPAYSLGQTSQHKRNLRHVDYYG
jgi:hypothetical protein